MRLFLLIFSAFICNAALAQYPMCRDNTYGEIQVISKSAKDSSLIMRCDSIGELQIGDGGELVMNNNITTKRGKKWGFGTSKGHFVVSAIDSNSITLRPYIESGSDGSGIIILGALIAKARVNQDYVFRPYRLNPCIPQDYTNQSGGPIWKGCYCDEKKLGEWIDYYPSGQVKRIANYGADEMKVGTYIRFTPDGDTLESGSYRLGSKEGTWRVFDENGSLIRIEHYLKGVRSGKQIEYYANGQVKKETRLIMDVREGTSVEYSELGTVAKRETYSGGKLNGVYQVYSNTGQILENLNYNYGQLDGEQKYYHNNGLLKRESNYTNGLKNGYFHSYFENGYDHISAYYVQGKLDGEFERRFENGQIAETGQYIEHSGGMYGDKGGLWKTYHTDGDLSTKGKYARGQKVGKWSYWDKSRRKTTENFK